MVNKDQLTHAVGIVEVKKPVNIEERLCERKSYLFCFLSKALQHIMMNAHVKLIWLVSLQCLMVELVSLQSTTSVLGFTSEFPLNLIGFCKGAQRNIVLKMSCVIGEYVVKYIHSVFNSVKFLHIL